MANRKGKSGNWQILFSWAPKSLWTVTVAMKLKDTCSLEESYDKPGQPIKKQRHHFADKDLYGQSYGFSSSCVWVWDLGHEVVWGPKNWCFQTVVLGKTLESHLDCKEIKPINHKENQPWIFIGRIDADGETPVLWPPDAKSRFAGKDPNAGKDWGQEKGVTEDEMVGWCHWHNGFSLSNLWETVEDRGTWHAAVHGFTKSRTQLSNWTELNCES